MNFITKNKSLIWILPCIVLGVIVILVLQQTTLDAVLRWQVHSEQIPDINYILSLNASALTNESRYDRASMFVSICPSKLHRKYRTGNQMFLLASMLHVAKITNRTLVMPRNGWNLDKIFDIHVPRFDDYERQICPCVTVNLAKFKYDKRFDKQEFIKSLSKTQGSILVCGLSQTYRYAAVSEQQVRQTLQFPANVSAFAGNFLRGLNVPHGIKVGVHVRRGDFLRGFFHNFGLSTADKEYFDTAFKYFTDRYTPVQFVVATEDRKWSLANLPQPSSRSFLTFTAANNTAAQDLAILSMCDGVIMSTGSFGWWAAWLANKTTIYYSDWPRNGSAFTREMDKKNYFPPNWIPI